jgi:hypothetical protein
VAASLLLASLPASGTDVVHERVVTDNPANWTPHALDKSVRAITQVGDQMVVGGNFTRIADNNREPVDQARVFAFDAQTGELNEGFRPQLDRGRVNAVVAHPDGDKVWIGGTFKTVNGVKRPKVALLSLSDGSVVTSFKKAGNNGKVLDLALVGEDLVVAGSFSKFKGSVKPALASVNASNGRTSPLIDLDISGVNNGGKTRVSKISATRGDDALVAIGNFSNVAGQQRSQVAVIDTSGASASVADWSTDRFGNYCSGSFDSYVRDVDVDPTGEYFVVATTGAYRSGRLCDTASRWELDASGSGLQPSWVAYTGGDTLYSVAISGPAVYLGGHQRWLNNSFAGDRPGPGAVFREGIAAVDPINGLPLSWDPGRTRGVGAFELTVTPDGLWVGSDTDRIGRWERRERVAFFPEAEGTLMPATNVGELPGRLLSLTESATVAYDYDGTVVGAPQPLGASLDAAAATMVDGTVYAATGSGTLVAAGWDGSSMGPTQTIPDLGLSQWVSDINAMTGLYYHQGRLYYTLEGSSTVYYRYFTTESQVVGADRFVATTGVEPLALAQGMTLAGDRLLWVEETSGELKSMATDGGIPTGADVRTLGGPEVDGVDYRHDGLLLEAR